MELRSDIFWRHSELTLADLCAAIEDGRITFREDDDCIEVAVCDVRRLERDDEVLDVRFPPCEDLASLDAGCLS